MYYIYLFLKVNTKFNLVIVPTKVLSINPCLIFPDSWTQGRGSEEGKDTEEASKTKQCY